MVLFATSFTKVCENGAVADTGCTAGDLVTTILLFCH